MSATATAPAPAQAATAFAPVRLWNLLYPGQVIVNRKGWKAYNPKTGENDPARAEDDAFRFVYGALTVYNQEDLDFVLSEGRGAYIVFEDVPPQSPPLVCDKCGRETRSTQFWRIHTEKHSPFM